jgi:RES domain-containing protein
LLPEALVAMPVAIPDDVTVQRVRGEELPARWWQTPAPLALRERGTRWATAGATAVLAVPSAVVPVETNYLLNPRHPQMKRIQIGSPRPFALDERLTAALGRRET